MSKPKVLYHASKNDVTVIRPFSKTKPKDFNEGPVVFATPDFAAATKFLVPWDDGWAYGARFGDTHYLVVSDEARFKKEDKGAIIYMLPSDTFEKLNKNEWFSKVEVKPIDKKHFHSGLSAMKEYKVKVLFVDKRTFKKIKESDDHRYAIIQTLS